MPVVRTDGRAGGRSVYGHVITKISRMGSLPHFSTHDAPLRASRARALLKKAAWRFFETIFKHSALMAVAIKLWLINLRVIV